jgi:signal transduction histidine kinase/CheY-like chemotaxis protein
MIFLKDTSMIAKTPSRFTLSSDFRMSLGWAIALVLLLALLFISVSSPDIPLSERMKTLYLTCLFYVLALGTWLLNDWQPLLGRWLLVTGLAALVLLGTFWTGEATFIMLLVLPVALAMALLGFSAALLITLFETLGLLALSPVFPLELSNFTVVIVLMTLWFLLGLLYAIYHPIRQLTQWSFDHYWQAQELLNEARDRKAELQHVQAELVRSNWKLSLLNEKLHTLNSVADEARKTKETFVAKVSHEFRTPLNMIIALADLLLETPEIYGEKLPAPLLEDLGIVQRNCKHLASLVDDVLDLSQAEAGRLSLQREWVDLREAIDMVAEVVQPLIQKKKLYLKVECRDDLTPIYCDRTRIRQVMLNLVSNAARFTPQGGITLQVTQQINKVIVSVKDTGPGIAKDDISKVFEPFFQATGKVWQEQGGNGLGLSISKQFVELHEGRMWLESEFGSGSTFSFSLPVAPPAPQIARPEPTLEEWRWREPDLKMTLPRLPFKERIVVWDDRNTLASQLKHYGNDTEFVRTETLEQTLQTLNDCPTHAVMVNTSCSNEILERLEQIKATTPDIPIFAATFLPVQHEFLETGATNYLTKPVTLEKLSEAVNALEQPSKNILIVDDNPEVQQVLTRMLLLYKQGLTLTTASSGQEALELLDKEPFDLILLDLTLSDMSGWDVLKEKNKREGLEHIPVIIVSAQDPVERLPKSQHLVATISSGLSSDTVLRCSLELSKLLRGSA